jgi:hypothetical protein
LNANVRHSKCLEPVREPRGVLSVSGTADDASPEFRVPLVAIPPGNRRLLLDVAMKMFAVNPGVCLFAGRQRPFEQRVRAGRCGRHLRMSDRGRHHPSGSERQDADHHLTHTSLLLAEPVF